MSETDRRLKDHLNTNQAKRERMCLELLQNESLFSDVRPRLPKGGPDGGRDLEGDYREKLRVYGAVGFVNDATDTKEHRDKAIKKFRDDLTNIETAIPDPKGRLPKVFCFFTNVGLTPAIVDALKESAFKLGIEVCEVYDRERLRIMLDRPTGYAIRFRYLDLPLSEPEQQDFFATWGDQIQKAMSSNLSEISTMTRRLNFLTEAQFPVDKIRVLVKLSKELGDIAEGNFVFQTSLTLRAHVDGLIGITFGCANEPIVETIAELRAAEPHFPKNGQIGFAFSQLWPGTPQFMHYKEILGDGEGDEIERWMPANGSSGILELDKSYLRMEYGGEPFLERFYPTCNLMALHGALILFECNEEIAEHIEEITMTANEYIILELIRGDFKIERGSFDRLRLPDNAHQSKDSHTWATLRPSSLNSCFHPEFIGQTPTRWRSLK